MNTNRPPLPTSQARLRQYFLVIAGGCWLFILLTLIAMFFYSGGTALDPSSRGYSFVQNFFSNLGMTVAPSGRSNWVSAVLFFLSLSTAGACLALFFVLFPRFFSSTPLGKVLCLIGSFFGVLAGICFVGVAFSPADLLMAAHVQFVMWAFRLFPLAVLFYIPAMFMEKSYPRRYAWVFAVFCLMLIGYFLLLTYGPDAESTTGLVIQVVGQKVIAYASILSIGIQSLGAYRFLEKSNQ